MNDAHDPATEEDIAIAIAEAIGCEIGDAFLVRVVDVLRRYMRASLVLIGVGQGTPIDHTRAIFALRDGQGVQDISYDLTGTPCEMVYSEQDNLVVPCDLAQRFPREIGIESYVGVPLRDAQGDVRGHLAVFSPEPMTQSDRVAGLVAVFAQRVEAELRRMEFEAERDRLVADLMRQTGRLRVQQQINRNQNAYKTRLLGVIAHDLRNPLAAILSQAELAGALLARPEPVVEKVARACDKVVANADRISALIDATLKRVREEDSQLSLSPEPCDLGALIRIAVEVNQPEATRKSIKIRLGAIPDMEITVDEELMMRAVDNLISNAVKYSDPGGWVQVSGVVHGDGVRIAVADNGQGLSAGDISRAFGRFETLSAKPTGGETATGLGLSNVKEIVEAHGGGLSVDSAGIGQGAVFTIALPKGQVGHSA